MIGAQHRLNKKKSSINHNGFRDEFNECRVVQAGRVKLKLVNATCVVVV